MKGVLLPIAVCGERVALKLKEQLLPYRVFELLLLAKGRFNREPKPRVPPLPVSCIGYQGRGFRLAASVSRHRLVLFPCRTLPTGRVLASIGMPLLMKTLWRPPPLGVPCIGYHERHILPCWKCVSSKRMSGHWLSVYLNAL